MTTRERYYLLDHLLRLSIWQTEQAVAFNRERARKRLELKRAHREYRLQVHRIARLNREWFARLVRSTWAETH